MLAARAQAVWAPPRPAAPDLKREESGAQRTQTLTAGLRLEGLGKLNPHVPSPPWGGLLRSLSIPRTRTDGMRPLL